MRIGLIKNAPHKNPRQWYKYAYPNKGMRKWDFNKQNNNKIWVFPLLSKEAQKFKITYKELDYDSDRLLYDLIKNYWSPDIIQQNLNEKLVEKAKEFLNADKNYQQLIEINSELSTNYYKAEYFINNTNNFFTELLFNFNDISKQKINEYKNLNNDDLNRMREEYEDSHKKESLIEKHLYRALLVDFLITLVSDTTYHCSEDIKEKFINDFLLEDENFVNKKDKLDAFKNDYWFQLLINPQKFLPIYFYDEMVYMNYVQTRVVHDSDAEKKAIEKYISFNKKRSQHRNKLIQYWFINFITEHPTNIRTWWT